MNKKHQLSAVCACLFAFCLATPTSAAISPYAQDFEGLGMTDAAALSSDGWLVWGDVWTDAVGGIYNYGYGPFPAPNGGAGFSRIAGGEGGPAQGTQYLNVYSDYNNTDHASGKIINTSVFREFIIDAAAVNGDTWTLTFDAKSPFLDGIADAALAGTQASAFIRTLDPASGYVVTRDIRVDTTGVSNTDWDQFSLQVDLSDALLAGQLLQFGFNTTTTYYDNSGVYFDNICFDNAGGCPTIIAAVTEPPMLWLLTTGLIGLLGFKRRVL